MFAWAQDHSPWFVASKEPGESAGPQLVYNIFKESEGSIDIASPEFGDTLVRMRFPPADSSARPAGETAAQ